MTTTEQAATITTTQNTRDRSEYTVEETNVRLSPTGEIENQVTIDAKVFNQHTDPSDDHISVTVHAEHQERDSVSVFDLTDDCAVFSITVGSVSLFLNAKQFANVQAKIQQPT